MINNTFIFTILLFLSSISAYVGDEKTFQLHANRLTGQYFWNISIGDSGNSTSSQNVGLLIDTMANGTAISYNYLTKNSTAVINITNADDDTIIVSKKNDLKILGHKAKDDVCIAKERPLQQQYCMLPFTFNYFNGIYIDNESKN